MPPPIGSNTTAQPSWELHKYVGGAITTDLALRTGLSLAQGDVIRLEVQGTTLRIKVNGVQLGASVSDADIATGAAGFLTGNLNPEQADDWEGGNVLAGGPFAQDGFTGTGPLSSNWTGFDVTPVRNDNMLRGNSDENTLAYWDADTFSPDQYSQIVLGANPSEVGVAVRISGTAMANASAYWLEYHDSTELGLHKYVEGAITINLALRTGLSLAEGDTIRLEVEGTTLRIKLNGAQLGPGTVDADIATGAAGLIASNFGMHQADDWEAGPVSGGPLGAGPAFAREPFTGTGALSIGWTGFDTPAVRDDDMLRGNSEDNALAYWNAGPAFSPDQYAQIVLGANPSEVGVAVRVSGTSISNASAYWLEYHNATELGLHKYVDGTVTTNLALRTGLSLVAGDTIRLEVEGTTLRIKVNGVQLGADASDTDIANGRAGFLTGNPTPSQADNWEGGDLGGGGGQVPAIAPDSVPEGYYAPENLVTNEARFPHAFYRDIIGVLFSPTATPAQRLAAVNSVQGTVIGGVRLGDADGFHLVQLPPDSLNNRVLDAADELETLPGVSAAMPDFLLEDAEGSRRPNDGPGWSQDRWQLVPDSAYNSPDSNWALVAVGAPLAWGCDTGSTATSIAVIDMGLHDAPDLHANIAASTGVVSFATDTNPHGTFVAGLIAAVGNNDSGVTGMMWRAGLRLYDVTQRNGDGTPATHPITNKKVGMDFMQFTAAITAAANSGARVINLSLFRRLSGPVTDSITVSTAKLVKDVDTAFVRALRAAPGRTPLIVVIAGNNGADSTTRDPYWSVFPTIKSALPNQVLVVAAGGTTRNSVWSGSSRGGTLVDVAAPGHLVEVLHPNGIAIASGTSFAAPLVTGLAGLLFSFDTTLTAAEVRDLIIDGAGSSGMTAGPHPLINAYESLKRAARRHGAPLCGNRIRGSGTGAQGRLVIQRGTVAESVTVGARVYQPSVYHGGRQIAFLAGLEHGLFPDSNPIAFTGYRVKCRALFYNPATRGWTQSGPYCDSWGEETGPPPTLTGTLSGAAFSTAGGSHDGDSVISVQSCGQGCSRVMLDDQQIGDDIIRSIPSDSAETVWEVAYSPMGDRALVALSTEVWRTYHIPQSVSTKIRVSADVYQVTIPSGAITNLNWDVDDHGIWFIGLSEDGQTAVAGIGESPFPTFLSTPCTLEYRTPGGSILSAVSTPDACSFHEFQAPRRPGSFGNVRTRP